jgi:acyl-CoA thioesterase-1
MARKLMTYIGLIILVVIVAELIGLAYLWYGLKTYPAYWQGRANQPGEFLYVALGDSAAQGVGASKPANGYVGLIAANIEKTTGKKVRVINLSKSGATLADALRDQTPQLDNYRADLVTVEVGANDMKNYNPETFRQQYEQLLQALPPGKSVASDMPYFGGRPNHTRNARDANITIKQLAEQYQIPQAELFDNLSRHQSPLIYASDLFHPNNRGYKIWHDAFWADVQQMIVSSKD